MPKARTPFVSTQHLLDQALTCFAAQGLASTSIDVLTAALQVSNRTLYRELGNKATIVEAVYAYATGLLLRNYSAEPHPGETLPAYLERWWQQTAAAAQADPRAFRYWQFYRLSPHLAAGGEPVWGPFAAIPDLLTQLLGPAGGRRSAPAWPLPVLGRWWLAQWTAAVELVLTDPTCAQQPALSQRVLRHAFTSWWLSLGLPSSVAAVKAPTKPSLATRFVQELAAYYQAPAPPALQGIAALQAAYVPS